jgi:hypothetical protein
MITRRGSISLGHRWTNIPVEELEQYLSAKECVIDGARSKPPRSTTRSKGQDGSVPATIIAQKAMARTYTVEQKTRPRR